MISAKVATMPNEMLSNMNLWYIQMTLYAHYAITSRIRSKSIRTPRIDQCLPEKREQRALKNYKQLFEY